MDRIHHPYLSSLAVIALVMVGATALACGTERWPVKVGNDPDAKDVDISKAVSTTIENLDAINAPTKPPNDARVGNVEKTVYVLNAEITAYKAETDQDYHLALSDGNGHTMIAEIPDPSCADKTSPFLAGIQKARAEFDSKLHAGGSFKHVHIPVKITGVGFFDFNHGQLGVAPNAIELHPVLDIEFK